MTNTRARRPWLVMLYLAGDDAPKEGGIEGTMCDAVTRFYERVLKGDKAKLANNQAMHLVVLADGVSERGIAPRLYCSDENRLVERGDLLKLWDLMTPGGGDIDAGYGSTLQNFITHARAEFRATHSMLALIGHGGGWAPNFGTIGPQPGGHPNGMPGWRGVCMDFRTGNALGTKELGDTLKMALGEEKLDVLFLDACLMGMIECAYEVRDYAHYMISAQNWLWAQLPYEEYLKPSVLHATTEPGDLARHIVASYNERRPYLPFTLAALKLDQLEALGMAVENLAALLLKDVRTPSTREDYCKKILGAYENTQPFDLNADGKIEKGPKGESAIDLRHFAEQLKVQNIHADVNKAADRIIDVLRPCLQYQDEIDDRGNKGPQRPSGDPSSPCGRAVLAVSNRSGKPLLPPRFSDRRPHWDFSQANGISIYMPLGMPDSRPIVTGSQVEQDLVASASKETGSQTDQARAAPDSKLWLEYYQDGRLLSFTNHLKSWPDLLVELAKYKWPDTKDFIDLLKQVSEQNKPPHLLAPLNSSMDDTYST